MTITARIESFKSDIRQSKYSSEQIFQKHVIDGPAYFFENYFKDPSIENTTKSIIANAFSVHVRETIFVGSGKLGFSLKPGNVFNGFDTAFHLTKLNKDRSDLDVAIVSNNLFETLGKKMYNYTAAYKEKWKHNEYYDLEKMRQFSVPICYKYFEYHTKGWFRPDFKPQGFECCTNGSYQNLKGDLYLRLKRKVGIAIYQNWFYFMDYHLSNIDDLKLKLNSVTI